MQIQNRSYKRNFGVIKMTVITNKTIKLNSTLEEFIKDLEMRKRFDSYTSPYTNQGEKLYRDVLKIQKLKKEAVDKYKEELKEKVNKLRTIEQNNSRHKRILIYKKEILELLK